MFDYWIRHWTSDQCYVQNHCGYAKNSFVRTRYKVFSFIFNEFSFRTIKSVEDHIKECISKEASLKKSIFNNISIDIDSINIQRLLDHEILKSSSFINIEVGLTMSQHPFSFNNSLNFRQQHRNQNIWRTLEMSIKSLLNQLLQ